MSQIYHNIQRIEIGPCCPGASTYITNVVMVRMERIHPVLPRRVMRYKPPTGWLQPHSWELVEIYLLSDHTGLDDYVKWCADNEEICIFKIIAQGGPVMASDPWVWGDAFPAVFYNQNYEFIVQNALPTSYVKQLLNYDDSVWVYRFIADCVKLKEYPPPC